jgi:probable rRNA maturation factor
MPEIINNQRKIKINKEIFQTFAETALEKIGETEGRDFTIAFISDRKMRELNNNFRGQDLTTDVLSFTFEADKFEIENDNLGDIAISLEQAERQAQDNKFNLETEIKQLILHGILHLCGYDHETDNGEMNKRELELRAVLEIN